jgi:hypothetical protein
MSWRFLDLRLGYVAFAAALELIGWWVVTDPMAGF